MPTGIFLNRSKRYSCYFKYINSVRGIINICSSTTPIKKILTYILKCIILKMEKNPEQKYKILVGKINMLHISNILLNDTNRKYLKN